VALVADFAGDRLAAPFEFRLDREGVDTLVARVHDAVAGRDVTLVRVGVEAAGHYHRPLTTSGALPADWEVVELNPAHVAAQRRVQGKASVKTDPADVAAIFDMIVAGRGYPVPRRPSALVELTAWDAHRRRRLLVRTATKNQLQTQLDRCFPGASTSVSSLFDTQIGRLVLGHFTDPARLARLGAARFRQFAQRRGVRLQTAVAERLVDAARNALPAAEAHVARAVIAADLDLLDELDAQIAHATARLETLLPATPFKVLLSGPGWQTVRAAKYGAALGDPARWHSAKATYRAAGLTPRIYESAGRRRDGGISREGSVALRQALIDLGFGLWHTDPTAKTYAASLRARGKPGGIIITALANRAARIAYAMVRDQTIYDPTVWTAWKET
jgi:transposase